MHKSSIILAIVVICVLLVSGCATTTTTTPAATASPTPTATPSETPQYGGTLRIIEGAEMTNLGFPPDTGMIPEDYYQQMPVFETLDRLDENGKILPFLAESYEEFPDVPCVIWHLRQGVKFQDGTDCDAEAVKWNLQMAANGTRTGWDFALEPSFDVLDKYTLRVNMSQYDSCYLDNMTWDSCMISPTAYKTHGKDWELTHMVGTGPFMLDSYTRDVQKTFVKWDGYWQKGKPYLDKIVIDIIADPMIQKAAFLRGDDDVLVDINPTDAADLQNRPGVYLSQAGASGEVRYLWPNSANPNSPFSKLEVRQALSYAIDCPTIIDKVFKGFGVYSTQIVRPGAWSYNPDVVGYPYNPQKAKDLLTEAGYPDGFDTTITFRNTQLYTDMATACAGYLAAVGIRATLNAVDAEKMTLISSETGWDDIIASWFPCDPETNFVAAYLFPSDSTQVQSKMMIHPKDMDDAIHESMTSGLEKRTELYKQLEYYYIDKYDIFLPVALWFQVAAKSTKVHDEYSCTAESTLAWTFANAWIEH